MARLEQSLQIAERTGGGKGLAEAQGNIDNSLMLRYN
jgi:hypothetical protein